MTDAIARVRRDVRTAFDSGALYVQTTVSDLRALLAAYDREDTPQEEANFIADWIDGMRGPVSTKADMAKDTIVAMAFDQHAEHLMTIANTLRTATIEPKETK